MMFSCLGLVKSWMYTPIYLSISAYIKCLVIITETEQLQTQKGRTNRMDAERQEMHCVGKQPTKDLGHFPYQSAHPKGISWVC